MPETAQKPLILTVTELNQRIRDLLEGQFSSIWVEGEVSTPKTYPSGHTYFTLKDEQSQLSAVLFRGVSSRLKFKLEHGLVVLARGRVSAYLKRGQYQLIVEALEPKQKGALQLAFEQLKKKLEAEGLFDPGRKRPLPDLPQRIGIVTSPKGAAVRDMLSILKRRFENLEIILYPVRVQGDEAKHEIAEAIQDLNREFPKLEVLLVGRGGGSLEDLWAFNEEKVARAIAGSAIPVISCVGHETDFTIADFVADLRAPTPSAAAELVVQNKEEVVRNLAQLSGRLGRALQHRISNQEIHLHHLVKSRLVPVLVRRVDTLRERFDALLRSTAFRYPMRMVEERARELDDLCRRLLTAAQHRVSSAETDAARKIEKLNILSPLAVLGRGYSIAFRLPTKKVVRSSSELKPGDRVELRFHQGTAEAEIVGSTKDVGKQTLLFPDEKLKKPPKKRKG